MIHWISHLGWLNVDVTRVTRVNISANVLGKGTAQTQLFDFGYLRNTSLPSGCAIYFGKQGTKAILVRSGNPPAERFLRHPQRLVL